MPTKKKQAVRLTPFPLLRKAVAAVWQHHNLGAALDAAVAERGHQTSEYLRGDANLVARQSTKTCVLCGAGGWASVRNGDVNWSECRLCDCLSDLVKHDVWHAVLPGPVSGPADLLEVLRRVDAHARVMYYRSRGESFTPTEAGMADSVPVLTRHCQATRKNGLGVREACSNRLVVRSGSVAQSVRTVLRNYGGWDPVKNGPADNALAVLEAHYRWPTKCKDCREFLNRLLQSRVDNAAPPTRRQMAAPVALPPERKFAKGGG